MNNLKKHFNLEFLKELTEYEKALKIVHVLFKNIKDKAGEPYIKHLLYVSDNLDTEEEKIVGLLHDLIEDTDVTYSELEEVGFSEKIINTLEILTKKNNENYSDYIDRIINSNDILALKVKQKDMENNMNKERLKRLPIDIKEKLTNKYNKEYKKINKKIGEYYDRY